MIDDDDFINNHSFDDQDSDGSSSNIGYYIVAGVVALITGAVTIVASKVHEAKAVQKARKEAYEQASEVYEDKFKELTEQFLSRQKDWKKEKEEYDNLLYQYERYIDEMNEMIGKNINGLTDEQIMKAIRYMETKRDELQKLSDDVDTADC